MSLVRISRELAIDPAFVAWSAVVEARSADGTPVAVRLLLRMDDGTEHEVRHAPGEPDGVDVYALHDALTAEAVAPPAVLDQDYVAAMIDHLLETAATDAGMKAAILGSAVSILVADAATQREALPRAYLATTLARLAAGAQAGLREVLADAAPALGERT